MKTTRISAIRFTGAILVCLCAAGGLSQPSEAAVPTQKQALAACKAKYGKKVVSAIVNKNGSITCQSRVTREMTRAEVFEACRKKYGATTIMVSKKKSGWVCRYYGRY